ncbi:MAG: hypothetical protein Q8N13_11065 [Acidovorax sp.]|jgi:hypothetical protein|nr:hypothetical protein [Acidovorax sp.]
MHAQNLHLAVLGAVNDLETVDGEGKRHGPTLRDLADKLGRMNDRELSTTVKNLKRRDKLCILRTVRIEGCCKPVAQYGLKTDAPKSIEAWRTAMAGWVALT